MHVRFKTLNMDTKSVNDDFILKLAENDEHPKSRRRSPHKPYSVSGIVRTGLPGHNIGPDGRRQYACNKCQATFQNPSSLFRHKSSSHPNDKIAQCPECFKILSSKGAIGKHMLSHKPRSEWPIKCPFCSRRFQAKSDLPRHFLTAAHKDDPRIPEHMSEEWKNLFKTCTAPPETEPTKHFQTIGNSSQDTYGVTDQKSDSESSDEGLEDIQVETILEIPGHELPQSSSALKNESPADSGKKASGDKTKYIIPPLSKFLQKCPSNKTLSNIPQTENKKPSNLESANTPGSYISIPQTSYIVFANPVVPNSSMESTVTSSLPNEANIQTNHPRCDMIKIEIVDPYRL